MLEGGAAGDCVGSARVEVMLLYLLLLQSIVRHAMNIQRFDQALVILAHVHCLGLLKRRVAVFFHMNSNVLVLLHEEIADAFWGNLGYCRLI